MSLATLDRRFPQKRAVITGGASGLGLASAELLAARGWRLGLLDRDSDRLAETVPRLRAAGSPHCDGFIVDTTDEQSVRSAIDGFAAKHGGIDVALNAAGVAVAGDLLETSAADWAWILGINVQGVVHSCRAEAPHMIAAGGGLIINVASAASFACSSRMSAYNASKAAVVALSETLFQEMAEHRVHVAVAMTGFFRTRLLEHARAGGCAWIRREDDAALEPRGGCRRPRDPRPGRRRRDPYRAARQLPVAVALQAARAAFVSAPDGGHPPALAVTRELK
jgi:NAD(P)-dependent dehydrogenase (short-subunit alcohol dehydrogenase family)